MGSLLLPTNEGQHLGVPVAAFRSIIENIGLVSSPLEGWL